MLVIIEYLTTNPLKYPLGGDKIIIPFYFILKIEQFDF